MERLTYMNGRKWCIRMGDTEYSGEEVDRLAAYESTGLEPEEVLSATDMAKVACALHELNQYKDLVDLDRLRVMMNQQISLREEVHERFKLTGDIPLDRLRELVQAEREKRCFTSPVTVGQTVWFVRDPKRHPENIVKTCVEKIIHKRTGAYMKLVCNSMYETACSSIGKTVFLTREAAAALKGETNK